MALTISEGRLNIAVNETGLSSRHDFSPSNSETFRRGGARWLSTNTNYGANERLKTWENCDQWTVHELISRHAAAQTALQFLGDAVGILNSWWYEVEYDSEGRECKTPLPVEDELNQMEMNPSPGMTRIEWIETLVWDVVGFGNAFFLKWRPEGSDRLWLLPLPPELITKADKKENSGIFRPGGYVLGRGRRRVRLARDEVLHFPASPSRGGWGRSPFISLVDALCEQEAAVSHRRSVYKSGASMAGFVEVPESVKLTSERLERVRLQLENRHTGSKRAGSIALLEGGMKWQPAQIELAALEYLGVRQLTKLEVFDRLRIPQSTATTTEGSDARSSKTVDRSLLYESVIAPLVQRIDERLTLCMQDELLRPNVRRITDWSMMLRPDPKAEAEALVKATGRPYMLTNEARAQTGRKPVEGGDTLFVPLNMAASGSEQAAANEKTRKTKKGRRRKFKSAGDVPDMSVKISGSAMAIKRISRGDHAQRLAKILGDTFRRQSAAVAEGGVGAFDLDRYNDELGADLKAFIEKASADLWETWANELEFDSEPAPDWAEYAEIEAASAAAGINVTTLEKLEQVEEDGDPTEVFADDRRTEASANRTVSTVIGFVGIAAGTKSGYTSKRWVPTKDSDRHPPEPSSVPIDGTFSNGGRWPGEGSDTFGCACILILER